jgi:hypothetical protein
MCRQRSDGSAGNAARASAGARLAARAGAPAGGGGRAWSGRCRGRPAGLPERRRFRSDTRNASLRGAAASIAAGARGAVRRALHHSAGGAFRRARQRGLPGRRTLAGELAGASTAAQNRGGRWLTGVSARPPNARPLGSSATESGLRASVASRTRIHRFRSLIRPGRFRNPIRTSRLRRLTLASRLRRPRRLPRFRSPSRGLQFRSPIRLPRCRNPPRGRASLNRSRSPRP